MKSPRWAHDRRGSGRREKSFLDWMRFAGWRGLPVRRRWKKVQPKRTKCRKAHKGRIHGDAKGGTALNFGSVGLKAMEPERITARQIEAARRAITRHIKRQGRLWIRI